MSWTVCRKLYAIGVAKPARTVELDGEHLPMKHRIWQMEAIAQSSVPPSQTIANISLHLVIFYPSDSLSFL